MAENLILFPDFGMISFQGLAGPLEETDLNGKFVTTKCTLQDFPLR
jgi:hypothetical protein